MIFPTDKDLLEDRVRYLIDRCLSTRDDRDRMYQYREKYYLFGTSGYEQARYNKIEPHLDLVTAFLYSPDHAFYHIAAENNSAEIDVNKATALQDDWNEDFQANGMSEVVMEAIPWSLVYDTMLLKEGWNRDTHQSFLEVIPPHNFGVYREDISDLDTQQAFCHTYTVDYHVAYDRLLRAGRRDDVDRLEVTRTPSVSPFPEMMQRMIISGTGGSNLSGPIFGQVNPDYAIAATYQPETKVPLVRFNELWAWDDEAVDYRIFHMLEPDILVGDSKRTIDAYKKAGQKALALFGKLDKLGHSVSGTNLFFPGMHPFIKIQPFGKFNYFWGKSHIDALIPLQEWMLERLEEIADMMERQAYPARVGSGFMGLTEEKMAAWGAADTFMFDQVPQAKIQEFKPEMPPDIFAEVREIFQFFLEASGLTEVISGRSESGVRSKQHAAELKKTGGGRIKKAALAIEPAIVRIGDIGLRLKQAHDDKMLRAMSSDDKMEEFLACDVRNIKMKVDGHSHSPLFGDEARELAVMYRKFGAIDNEDFIRMTNPPSRDTLLHNLRVRQRKEREAARRNPQLLQGGKGKRK